MAQRRPAEKRSQVYRCTKCSTIVEILEPGRPSLVHCGEPMELLEEQVAPAAENKHVPVIEKVDGGYKVKVGSTAHPMTEDHYIAWIELLADGKVYRQFLNPGDSRGSLYLVVDDTLLHKRGKHVYGLGWFRDAVASTAKRVATASGNHWVVVGLAICIPGTNKIYCLPIHAKLHLAGKNQKSEATLAKEMLGDILAWTPIESWFSSAMGRIRRRICSENSTRG